MNRLKKIQEIRKKLNEKEYSIGSWMQIPHPSIAEIMGNGDFDWVALDMEHGSISLSQLPDIFRSLELGNTLPLARLSKGTEIECKQVLDAGAGGIIVPMIKNAEELKKIKNFIYWPPKGERGIAFSRANLFGRNFNNYFEESQQPILIAMIENIDAVKNLDEIIKVTDLDGVFIGPYDLSASLGCLGEFDNKIFLDTVNKIFSTAKENNVPCGIHIVEPDIKELKKKIELGYQIIAFSIDSVFLNKSMNINMGLRN